MVCGLLESTFVEYSTPIPSLSLGLWAGADAGVGVGMDAADEGGGA